MTLVEIVKQPKLSAKYSCRILDGDDMAALEILRDRWIAECYADDAILSATMPSRRHVSEADIALMARKAFHFAALVLDA